MMKKFALLCIQFYQKAISPYLGQNCRFYPTCSHYAADAISNCGVLKGTFLGFWRILRCNPFNKGGVDFPPNCNHEKHKGNKV